MGEELTVRLWRLLNDASERCALNSNELCLLDEARVEILRLQGYQRIAAEISDKLNGTPCAEARWNAERERLIARAEEAERKLWRLEWEAEHGPLDGILGADNG